MLEKILNKYDQDFLKADGLDEAIIGVYEGKLVYSESKCIEVLSKDMGEEAAEYFYFNVAGAYMGEQTPIFIEDYFI